MSEAKGLEAKLKMIADLIREKAGTEDLMNIDEMTQAVLALDIDKEKSIKEGGGVG